MCALESVLMEQTREVSLSDTLAVGAKEAKDIGIDRQKEFCLFSAK